MKRPHRITRMEFRMCPTFWLDWASDHGPVEITDKHGKVRAVISVPPRRKRGAK